MQRFDGLLPTCSINASPVTIGPPRTHTPQPVKPNPTNLPPHKPSTHLEAAHAEQQVGVVLAVHADEAVGPLQRGDAARQPVAHVPEHRAPQVHVVLHQPHARVARPALLVVVAHDVLVIGVGVLREVALDQVTGLLGTEPAGMKRRCRVFH
eukprot:GHRQ01028399.1.p1 GENE.GHRQ01028399.1~~GHRQ01028399.1.p1  ORF type:complete len:152 (+),score=6.44 GHRQ01028399.1:617-1072(+)